MAEVAARRYSGRVDVDRSNSVCAVAVNAVTPWFVALATIAGLLLVWSGLTAIL